MKSAIRNRAFRTVRTRRLLQCGTAIPLALLATPAFASCTVEEDTTTCTGDISTSINGTPAILALGDEVTVTSSGTLTTTGDVSAGIGALRGFTYDHVADQGTFDASASLVSITHDGDITTGGEESYGIAAGATQGMASVVTTGDISTAGDYSHGIVATGDQVAIDFDGTLTTAGAEASGVLVADFAMIDGEAEIVGPMAGNATISGGSVATSGHGSAGIYALAGGDLTVTAGSVSTSGIGAMGVRGTSINGDVSVTLDSVATSGEDDGLGNFAEGVMAESLNGTVSVNLGSASAEGFAASAAVALGGAGASITVDDASAAGQHAAVLYAASANGGVTVEAGSIVLRGDQQAGVNAFADGGKATVSVGSIDGQGTQGNGINVEGTNGIEVKSGSINVQGYGIRAHTESGDSDVTIATTGDTIAGTGYAMLAEGLNVSVTTAEGTLTSGASGIRAKGTDSVTIANGGTATATGDFGSAIHATAPGAVSITSNAVTVTGAGADPGVRDDGSGYRLEQGGIIVEGGDGAISIAAGSVEVEGEHRYGISARGNSTIDISADDVTLASADSVAVVGRGGAGDISITTGAVTTTGASGVGVFGNTTTGNVTIDAGTTRVENEGMEGWFTGDAVVGISDSGLVSISSESAFSAGLYGSAVVGLSGGNVSIESGVAETTGDGGVAVLGQSYSGDVAVSAVDTTLSGNGGLAILARADAGDASLTIGSLTATGAQSSGAFARADSGTASIVATGYVAVADGYALRAQGATVSVETGEGTTTSGTTGILVHSTGAVDITNGGTVTGTESAISVNAAGDISITSDVVTASGDDGYGIYAESSDGDVIIDSGSVTTSGDYVSAFDAGAVVAHASNGTAEVRVRDVTVAGQEVVGVSASGLAANITVDGTVTSPWIGVAALAPDGTTHVEINGSVTSDLAAVSSVAQHGFVEIAEEATVAGAIGVVLYGGPQGGLTELHNSGTIHGDEIAVVGDLLDAAWLVADFHIRNDGTLTSGEGLAVMTGAGDDALELTENSIIDGIADLGDGLDSLVLGFNVDAPADALGQVASTVNVENLVVDSGSWLANGVQSEYAAVQVTEGMTLTIAEGAEGEIAVEAPAMLVDGTLRVDFSAEDTDGDFAHTLITGSGSVHFIGTSTVVVEDGSSLQYTGGTYVENGGLRVTGVLGSDVFTSGEGVFQLGDGGTAGEFTGDIVNDGTFVYARSDSYSLTGGFSGSGVLIKNGAGTLTFAGLYDFLGTTTVNAGAIAFTGQLSEDTQIDLSGDGVFDLSQVEGGQQTIGELGGTGGALALGSTNLTINQSTNTTFGGSITGDGSLTKEGEGDLKLEGDSNFSGNANVNGGILSVNGSFQSASFFVNEGGTLGGNGTVGDTSIQGGTLGAGNSIGELTVAGDLTFTADSVIEVEVDPVGNADLINVTGTATLGGATVSVLAEAGTYAPITDYTILTADGGVDGTFGAVNTNLAYLVPLLSYTVDSVSLRLSRNDIDFSAYAATPNQAAVGNLIESLGFGNALYDATLVMSRSQVATNFETLTGGVYPSYSASLIETADMLRRQTSPQPQTGVGAFVWGTALAGELKGEDGNGVTGFKTDNTGVAGGLGYATGGFDFAVGLGKLWQDPDRSQVSDSEVKFALAQASYDSPTGISARAGVQFGWVDAKASRNTALGTLSATVNSAFEGEYAQYFGEIGYALPAGAVSIEPFAGISHVALEMDRFTEVGGATALTVDGLDRDVTFADVGLRVAAQPVDGVAPYLSGAYRRAWGDRLSEATIAFAGNTAGGTITGLPIARSAAEVEAGIRYSGGVVDLELGYSGSLSKIFDSNNVKISASIHF